jgi:hypothetical protein
MTSALATAGFFLVVVAALRFSNWVEGWLTSNAKATGRHPSLTPGTRPLATSPSQSTELDAIRAA